MKELRRLALLLFFSALLLSLCFSQGLGRNVYAAAAGGSDLISRAHRLQPNKAWHHHLVHLHPHPNPKERMKVGRREMRENEIETNDYDDPKANVNPRGGPLLNPTTPTPTPVTPPPNHSR